MIGFLRYPSNFGLRNFTYRLTKIHKRFTYETWGLIIGLILGIILEALGYSFDSYDFFATHAEPFFASVLSAINYFARPLDAFTYARRYKSNNKLTEREKLRIQQFHKFSYESIWNFIGLVLGIILGLGLILGGVSLGASGALPIVLAQVVFVVITAGQIGALFSRFMRVVDHKKQQQQSWYKYLTNKNNPHFAYDASVIISIMLSIALFALIMATGGTGLPVTIIILIAVSVPSFCMSACHYIGDVIDCVRNKVLKHKPLSYEEKGKLIGLAFAVAFAIGFAVANPLFFVPATFIMGAGATTVASAIAITFTVIIVIGLVTGVSKRLAQIFAKFKETENSTASKTNINNKDSNPETCNAETTKLTLAKLSTCAESSDLKLSAQTPSTLAEFLKQPLLLTLPQKPPPTTINSEMLTHTYFGKHAQPKYSADMLPNNLVTPRMMLML
ncbi:MAG: hypothetical protein Tsb005_06830 [Gammaproteobacteria bacterium]